MANQYVLTTDAFVTLSEEKGIIQNVGIEDVELVSGSNEVAGEGIILQPGQKQEFSGAVSARRMGDNKSVINVVDFKRGGEGGETYVPKGSVAFASLPANLDSTMLGWTYNVSDAFTTDSQFVEGSGVSYPAGQNVVVVEASAGVYKYDCYSGAYILPVASNTVLGGVKSSSLDGGIAVNNDGTMSLNQLFYRKANTAYVVGDIVYHNALAVNQKLVCVKAGTSASSVLTLFSTNEGVYVTDGTAAWCIDSMADGNYTAGHGNGIYRGVDITAYWESGDMSVNIQAGKFVAMHIGDYITKTVSTAAATYTDKAGTEKTQAAATYTNVKWYVAGIDSHLLAGDGNGTTAHHVVLIAEKALQRNVSMNPTNDTTGGYIGSDMWRIHMPIWSTAIKAAFGESHVLKHREILSNTLNATAPSAAGAGWVGSTSNWAWTDVEVNIPNEQMVYGGKVSGGFYDGGDWPQQLPLFAFKQYVGGDERSWYWLRVVASASNSAYATGSGSAHASGASIANASGGIRPYFLAC